MGHQTSKARSKVPVGLLFARKRLGNCSFSAPHHQPGIDNANRSVPNSFYDSKASHSAQGRGRRRHDLVGFLSVVRARHSIRSRSCPGAAQARGRLPRRRCSTLPLREMQPAGREAHTDAALDGFLRQQDGLENRPAAVKVCSISRRNRPY
jgi:hypothetical protein